MSEKWQDDLDIAKATIERFIIAGDKTPVGAAREGLEALDRTARFIWTLLEAPPSSGTP